MRMTGTDAGRSVWLQTLVTDIVPDKNVRNAMNEINASQRLR